MGRSLCTNGLSIDKRFLLPGWRFGWIALHDPINVASSIRDGLAVWSNRFFGPNSLVQAALPAILETPAEWFEDVLAKVRANAEIVQAALSSIPGLSCSKPQGSLYLLVRIDLPSFPDFKNDIEFSTALYREQAIFVLPGVCFDAPGYLRFVIGSPVDVMEDVGGRLAEFCLAHRI
jgi:tyrosine aminotransferase